MRRRLSAAVGLFFARRWRSPPAQNAPPAPVMMAALSVGSLRISMTTCDSSSRIEISKALRFSGRFRVTMAISSRVSYLRDSKLMGVSKWEDLWHCLNWPG